MAFPTLLLFVSGLLFLVLGAESMIRSASRLAVSFGISPLVVGLTVVAFGTSAPELAVTVQAASTGETELGLGNIVGSNISNVLLILGVSAAMAPLVVSQKLVRLEVPLTVILGVVVWFMARDGLIGRFEGLALFVGAAAYTLFAIRQSRRESADVRAEYESELGGIEKPTRRMVLLHIFSMVIGLAMLVLGAGWLVEAALTVAEKFGLSELIAGLTIVAVGTSLPELATTVIATIRGQREIAVGNAIGSNLFNLLLVLGIGAASSQEGIVVESSALCFDLPVMIAVSVACLPIFFTGYRIDRWEGFLFLGYYAAYVGYLVLFATQHDLLPQFSGTMMAFVLPLTVLTLGITVLRQLRRNREGAA